MELRGEWEPTPWWLFWKPDLRRPVRFTIGHWCRWEYAGEEDNVKGETPR